MGFSRDHCEAVSETVAWVGDGAAIFDVPSFEPTPEPLEPDEPPAKPAGAPAAAEDSSGLDEEEDDGEEMERMAPPPVLEAVVYAAAWLDTEAWAVLIESAEENVTLTFNNLVDILGESINATATKHIMCIRSHINGIA